MTGAPKGGRHHSGKRGTQEAAHGTDRRGGQQRVDLEAHPGARAFVAARRRPAAAAARAWSTVCEESYSLDAVSVVLLDPQHEIRHLLVAGGDRPEEFKQIFFVDSLISLAPQLAALHKPWLGPFVGADHHLLVPGQPQSQKRRAGAAAAQGPGHRRAVLRQPRPDPVHAPSRHRFPGAPGRGRRGLHRERGQSGPAAARGHHRFPDRLAQPPLPAAAPEGGAGARAAARRAASPA